MIEWVLILTMNSQLAGSAISVTPGFKKKEDCVVAALAFKTMEGYGLDGLCVPREAAPQKTLDVLTPNG